MKMVDFCYLLIHGIHVIHVSSKLVLHLPEVFPWLSDLSDQLSEQTHFIPEEQKTLLILLSSCG